MYHSALVVHKSEDTIGSYTVKQLRSSDDISHTRRARRNTHLPLRATVGGFTISGFIDTVSLEATMAVDIVGVNLGLFDGNANRGFRINIDLELFKGSIELDVSPFDDIWLHISPSHNVKHLKDTRDQASSTHLGNLPSITWAS